MWRAKQGASPREALGEVKAQPCLSREVKGKMPLSVGSVAYASREAELGPQGREFLLASPNHRALVSSAKSAPLSEVKGVSLRADSVAYTASAPKGTKKVPSREAGTKALCSANYLRRNAKIKAPLRAKSEATMASLPMLPSAKLTLRGGAKRLASSSEDNVTGGVVLTLPVIKDRSFNVKLLQLEQPSTRLPRASVLDRLSLVNPDLREFLTNK